MARGSTAAGCVVRRICAGVGVRVVLIEATGEDLGVAASLSTAPRLTTLMKIACAFGLGPSPGRNRKSPRLCLRRAKIS